MAPYTVENFERHMETAQIHRESAELEFWEREVHVAKAICEGRGFPGASRCKLQVMIELAEIERRNGMYSAATKTLSEAFDLADGTQRISILGELAVVYRHDDRIVEAHEQFQEQYNLAKQLALEAEMEMCRAVGNLGMTTYQRYEQQGDKTDKALLVLSIKQLEERRERARSLQERLCGDPAQAKTVRKLEMWEAIGISRLTLPYAAIGDTKKAVEFGELTWRLTQTSNDPTVRGISRFFYGNALLNDGQRARALELFNFTGPRDTCTSAAALCKELSAEHRGYLERLVAEGVDLDTYDEQGYSALDHAVYGGDAKAEAGIVRGFGLKGLALTDIQQRQDAAKFRKHFRDIFQKHFRPVLSKGRTDCVVSLQSKYAELFGSDEDKRALFDEMHLVRYSDFLSHGKLPTMNDSLSDSLVHSIPTQQQRSRREGRSDYVVFFSYRWIGGEIDPPLTGPDDGANTQYRRMVDALERFLELHPTVDSDDLSIWLDCACIDQVDKVPGRRQRGIAALPFYVAQCNAMISLVDDQYYERAWCAVEVLIMQTLRESYKQHVWYEHRLHRPKSDRTAGLLEHGSDMKLKPTTLKLSFERDRLNVEFLERQNLLLGKAGAER
ncbi:hypothetical protein B0A55_09779 [Friedmanniomyces simplex]|uniref:Heterokaryon incompatibility domain-containing protein n=1 Tax=Friedmanniomyces simplex TaxID=329884 RepID=A0A4U0WM80_9PEZI|nr:hypothetical protein B0A55_09779 [Friedmanniomyces simplex]